MHRRPNEGVAYDLLDASVVLELFLRQEPDEDEEDDEDEDHRKEDDDEGTDDGYSK